jgi:hypothetical protein
VLSHLYNSRVAVYRLGVSLVNGMTTYSWEVQASPLDNVPVRLDLQFVRPGKDQVMPVEAGVAPQRSGVMFYDTSYGLKAGDRLLCVENDFGETPVSGMFEIRAIPDAAQGFSFSHHMEVQVFEVSQDLSGVFPGSE